MCARAKAEASLVRRIDGCDWGRVPKGCGTTGSTSWSGGKHHVQRSVLVDQIRVDRVLFLCPSRTPPRIAFPIATRSTSVDILARPVLVALSCARERESAHPASQPWPRRTSLSFSCAAASPPSAIAVLARRSQEGDISFLLTQARTVLTNGLPVRLSLGSKDIESIGNGSSCAVLK